MAQAMANREPTSVETIFSDPKVQKLIAEDAAKSRPNPKLLSTKEFLRRLNATV